MPITARFGMVISHPNSPPQVNRRDVAKNFDPSSDAGFVRAQLQWLFTQ